MAASNLPGTFDATMIDKWAARLGAKIESTAPIDYGTQYRLSRGTEKAIVNVYHGKKGTRVVVQQKSPLADELRGLSGTERPKPPPSKWSTWCGTDESGKGDYFGPLTVAAVAVTKELAEGLMRAGVRDCKTLSDRAVMDLDGAIRKACPFKLAGLMPEEYNSRYEEARNVNRLLGDLHGEVIAGVLEKQPDLEAAVTDQFGDESYVRTALESRKVEINLVQRPKADETDVAVAAASVVARAAFLRGLDKTGRELLSSLPLGAGPEVIEAARDLIEQHGRDALRRAAKLHFRTTATI